MPEIVSAGNQQVFDNIRDYGHHILHVLEDEENPGFSYSVGIYETLGQPELILVGLPRELSHWIINEYYARCSKGEIFPPQTLTEGFLEGFDVEFREMAKQHYPEYLGWSLWYYGNPNFPTYQMIYPTTSGIWPWDENAPEDIIHFQPLLFN